MWFVIGRRRGRCGLLLPQGRNFSNTWLVYIVGKILHNEEKFRKGSNTPERTILRWGVKRTSEAKFHEAWEFAKIWT